MKPALMVAALVVSGVLSACAGPTASPAAIPSPEPTPSLTPNASAAVAAPAGTGYVSIPKAGIRLPIPTGWLTVPAEDLADPAVRAEVAATYPGTDSLLTAADEMGERATAEFFAVDPSAAGTNVPLASNVAVLVSDTSVSGPLLDFVAGFIASGFEDALGATETERERVPTPVGQAVRLRYTLPGGGETPLEAAVWVIGAPSGTLVVSMMGPVDVLADIDPEALIAAAAPLP